jgi:predicted unusual protein kinase regulating ubiquinone biosynthesis (AarF/ABC1/UbiB family)
VYALSVFRTRYRRIIWFFARILASLTFWELLLPLLGLGRLVERTRTERLRAAAARFRALAIRMGGVMIKVGQFLSSRLDVLPEAITAELAGLQDEVPAESFDAIRTVAEAELGAPLAERYAIFEETPLAAASLGQVHRAWLRAPAGETPPDAGARPLDVVVKVQRPNIEAIIAIDLAALRTVGNWLQHYPPIRRRADIPALLAEFTRILDAEVDYLAEGRNAETFAANFRTRQGVSVPRVIWSHTTRRVLTLENVQAIKITDYAAITAAGIDRSEVAVRLLDTYLQQVFYDGFYHADPHPGNLFVAPRGGGDWDLVFVDFGMTGRLTPSMRSGLREAAIAVGTRDTPRLLQSYRALGFVLPQADMAMLAKAQEHAFERFWGKNMNELRTLAPREMRAMTGEFRELVFAMPFQVPQDMILLARTVAILSGMATGLDPDFNVWEHLAPFAQELLEADGQPGWQTAMDELGTLAQTLLVLPRRIDRVLSRWETGEIAVQTPQLTAEVRRLDAGLRRVAGAVVFAALLVAGVQLYLAGQIGFAGALLAGAGLACLWMIWPR